VGGDEFALIMPETDHADASAALERLRKTIESGLPGTTISIGFASAGEAYSPEILRDHADKALYEAKHKGKNQVAAFNPELSQGVEVTSAKTQALRRVIDGGGVEMWYQPIYHYGGHKLLAFEALLRMPTEPEIEGPQEAFEIAEGLGKARELDLLCVAGALSSAHHVPPDVKLFINLDPATLTNSRFSVQELTQLVDASPFERARIVFEVTEHSIVPVLTLRDQVEAIRSQGFGVALDDVGTGNSGLELMRLIKFDYVKIDRSVIIDASNGGQGRAVILAIVAFARETGAFMIAEGIEDANLLRGIRLDEPGLREFWVRGVQGFLLGEPRPSIASFLDAPGEPERAA
jgi:EAL domain-containing protein (putative c-di-GMP-specific phosphodiesterase class I)